MDFFASTNTRRCKETKGTYVFCTLRYVATLHIQRNIIYRCSISSSLESRNSILFYQWTKITFPGKTVYQTRRQQPCCYVCCSQELFFFTSIISFVTYNATHCFANDSTLHSIEFVIQKSRPHYYLSKSPKTHIGYCSWTHYAAVIDDMFEYNLNQQRHIVTSANTLGFLSGSCK